MTSDAPRRPRIGVTGATGHIGTALRASAAEQGIDIVALGRRPAPGVVEWRRAELGLPPVDDLLDGLDGVIHLAAVTDGSGSVSADSERAFAIALVQQAHVLGIPFVFVSSQAASPSAPSAYGRSKAAIELEVASRGGVSIRPGLVIGGAESGLFGLLCRMVRRSPLLPRLWPMPQVQPVHVDDLAAALLSAVRKPDLAGRTLAVAGAAQGFDQLLRQIADHRLRRVRLFVPMPVVLLRATLRLTRPLLGGAFGPERLDSLVGLAPLDAAADTVELGLRLRPAEVALERGGRGRRRILREAHALGNALFGIPPPASLSRRYVHMLQVHGIEQALQLHATLLRWPSLLAALDDLPAVRLTADIGSLHWRMGVMLRLAEAEPTLAQRFLLTSDDTGRLRVLCQLVLAASLEIRRRLQQPLARRLWRAAA